MKKLLLTLTLLLTLGFAAGAAEATVTYDFSVNQYGMTNGEYLADGTVLTEAPATITLNKKSGSNGFRLWNNNVLRFHKSSESSMTIAAGGATITKIELTVDGANFALDDSSTGTWSNNTWTGSATSVKLNYTTNGNKDVQKIVITYTDGGDTPDPTPVAPVITAKSGDTVYENGEYYEVEKGTQVVLTVSNYTSITASVGDEFLDENDFADGSYTATISDDTEIIVDAYNGDLETEHTYNFLVKEVVTPQPTAGGWFLVTDASTLAAGDLLIIANTEASEAMATTKNDNNRKASAVTITDNELTYTTEPLIVELGGTEGAWTFKTTNYKGTNGYFASATSGKITTSKFKKRP